MKTVTAVLASLLLLSVTVFAQQTAKPSANNPDPATREQVLKMMEVMNLRQQAAETMEAYKTQMSAVALEDVKSRMPNAPAAMFDELRSAFDEMFSQIPVNEIVDAIVPVYQKHLTKREVEATTAFYSTPEGKSMLKKLPLMVNEGMQVSLTTMKDRMDAASDRMTERVHQILQKYGQETHSETHKSPAVKPMP
jgi:hypothetical protein